MLCQVPPQGIYAKQCYKHKNTALLYSIIDSKYVVTARLCLIYVLLSQYGTAESAYSSVMGHYRTTIL